MIRHINITYPQEGCAEGLSSLAFLPKIHMLHLITKNVKNLNWGTAYKITGQKSSKCQGRGRLRNSIKLKETEETRQLITTCNPGSDAGQEKDTGEPTDNICICRWDNTIIKYFLILIITLWLFKMLTFRKSELRVCKNFFVPFLQLFINLN